jgi:hypothetical protein
MLSLMAVARVNQQDPVYVWLVENLPESSMAFA